MIREYGGYRTENGGRTRCGVPLSHLARSIYLAVSKKCIVTSLHNMNQAPTVLVIIPIKERSTRLPGKNLKELCGKPMMAYPIEAAKGAKGVSRVIVSTESEKIKEIAERYGAE